MWRCDNCGANLLRSTTECPICVHAATPGEFEAVTGITGSPPAQQEMCDEDRAWWMVVIGVLIPPLGLLFLMIYLAEWMTPEDENS